MKKVVNLLDEKCFQYLYMFNITKILLNFSIRWQPYGLSLFIYPTKYIFGIIFCALIAYLRFILVCNWFQRQFHFILNFMNFKESNFQYLFA